MSANNTLHSYGSVARALHWLTALLIFSAIGLGLYAEDLPFATGEELAEKARLFSLHKTVGIAIFFVALCRILWTLRQPHPEPLHPERGLETRLAAFVHWALYISLVMMPLSGWVHHAATDGFAPILWPLGQDLPFVPTSEAVAGVAGALHWVFSKILIATVLLHIAGAFKHAIFDLDATMSRMTSGTVAGASSPVRSSKLPAVAAVLVYLVGAGVAVSLAGPEPETGAPPAAQAATATSGNWQVQDGTLAITVKQLGTQVQGSFANWTADITFGETPVDGKNGQVLVTVDTTSLTLGSVTDQAKGKDFFDVATHPAAMFSADILADGEGYIAQGTLTLRGVTVPLALPLQLTITGDSATMTGTATLDRRDFGMGETFPDESSVGFAVVVTVDLTARKTPD